MFYSDTSLINVLIHYFCSEDKYFNNWSTCITNCAVMRQLKFFSKSNKGQEMF